MKKTFKNYIRDTIKNYDNSVTISYNENGTETSVSFLYVRVLKIFDNYICTNSNIININGKMDNMVISITGTIEKVVVDNNSMTSFESSTINEIKADNLTCGDLNNINSIKVENGDIDCADIITHTLNANSINSTDIQSDKIYMNSTNSEIYCGDISGDVMIETGNGDIDCADIGGGVNIGGNGEINCVDIGGDLSCKEGNISTGDVYGYIK